MIDRLYNKQVPAAGLGIFRIIYAMVLFAEVFHLFWFRHLVFDPIPYISPAENSHDPLLFVWLCVIVCVMLGLFTRTAAIISYICSIATFAVFKNFEYHMDYAYTGVNFLLMFLPVSRTLSLDSLIAKLKYSGIRKKYEHKKTASVLNYYLLLMLGVGLVYFDSVFRKAGSYNWTQGIGLWVPASLPFATYNTSWTFLLDNKVVALFLGYLTFFFELAFIFLVWFKRFRVPLLILGLGLHVGILVVFPIPFFALGVCSVYFLMVPFACWRKIRSWFLFKEPRLTFFYDELCPLCNRICIIVKHFDMFNAIRFAGVRSSSHLEPALKDIPNEELLANVCSVDRKGRVYKGVGTYIQVCRYILFLVPVGLLLLLPGIRQLANYIYRYVAHNRFREECNEDTCEVNVGAVPFRYSDVKLLIHVTLGDVLRFCTRVFIGITILLTCMTIYSTPVVSEATSKILPLSVVKKTGDLVSKITYFSKIYLGITFHGVYMDAHFNGYNHIIAVTYVDKNGKEVWLPIIRENGLTGSYLTGRLWVNWTFRVDAPQVDMNKLQMGIERYTAFWAYRNGIDLSDARFNVKVKKINVPRQWEKGFLQKQMDQPWQEAGYVSWTDRKMNFFVGEVEGM